MLHPPVEPTARSGPWVSCLIYESLRMAKLTVISVEPFTPGDESASVTLSSGTHEVVAFCWPCALSVGEVIENRLSILDGSAVTAHLADWLEEEKASSSEWIEHIGNYAYRGRGRVIAESEGTVEVMGFVIEFGNVLGSGYADFEIERLNIRS